MLGLINLILHDWKALLLTQGWRVQNFRFPYAIIILQGIPKNVREALLEQSEEDISCPPSHSGQSDVLRAFSPFQINLNMEFAFFTATEHGHDAFTELSTIIPKSFF